VSGNQTGTTFNAGVLAGGNYAWRIVPKNGTLAFTGPCANWTFAVSAPATTAAVGSSQSLCVGGTSAGLGGNTPASGTGAWSLVSGGGGTFANASDPNTTFTHTSGVGPILLRWTITPEAPCLASTADVSITISQEPTTANAGSAQTICSSPDATTMAANSAAVGSGAWTQTSGPATVAFANASSPTTAVSGLTAQGEYVLRWTISNAPCNETSSEVTITVVSALTWYADTDGDGLGDPNNTVQNCDAFPPTGYVANADDVCDTVFNTMEGYCNANGDASLQLYQQGLLDGCSCNVITTNNQVVLEMRTPDQISNEGSWEIRNTNGVVICAGEGYMSGAGIITLSCGLNDGCYTLSVFDSEGDGFGVGGGYQLRLGGSNPADLRIIDNLGNFNSGSLSAIGNGPSAFCFPMSTQKPIFVGRDKEDWVEFQYLVAEPDNDVSAQWQVGDQTLSGYQFWFFDPNGSYSFRRNRNHATSDGFGPANEFRACHMKINNWAVANRIPANVLMNVRIRARVAGVYGDFGPAYRFMIDPVAAACPLTRLNDIPDQQYLSCNSIRNWGPGNWVHARQVSGANRYQFRFRLPAENFSRTVTANTYFLQLNWGTLPLESGKTYNVDVRVSKDGGATWCTSGPLWGQNCTLTIGSGAQAGEQNLGLGNTTNSSLAMWPNPNGGDQLWIDLNGIEAGVQTVSVDIFDMTGKQVVTRIIPTQGDRLNTVLDLNGDLATGMYLVNITAGDKRYTERLVIAH